MKKHYTYFLALFFLWSSSNNANTFLDLTKDLNPNHVTQPENSATTVKNAESLTITGCPDNITVNVDPGTCGAVVNWPALNFGAGNTITQTFGLASGSIFPLGTTTNTFEERDSSNNLIDTCSFTVTVNDNEAPVPDVATLADITAECSVTSLTAPTATDNCVGSVTATHNATLPISGEGTTTIITWTYDDGNGNTSTQTQNVIIDDVTAPVADVASLADVTAECSVTSLTAPTATDNCVGSVTATHNATLPISGEGTTTVITWTYDDGNGNTSTQTQNVVIDDVTAPVADVASLADVTAECSVTSLTAPTATDNCVGSVTATHNATLPISGEGTTTVITWTYDDGNGNTSTQTQNVVIDDVTAPVADVASLADVTAECSVTSLTAPTATDNCVGSVTATHNATLPISGEGTTTVITWTYDDGNGNTSTQTQNVVIDDVTAPVADVASLADVTAECSVTSLTAPTATDNCVGSVTATHNATLPISGEGTTTVITWTYDDGNGNTSTQTQNVVIDDVTAPVADVASLADVTAECSVTSLTAPTATDNCVGSVTATHNATLPIFGEGTTTVITWTYDDGNGNTSTQTQNVVIDDVTAPVADVASLADVTAECSVTSLTPPTATDNCSGTITGTTTTTFPITTQGTTVITWNFDDGNGNDINVTQNVVINDTTNPTFNSCPTSVSINNNTGVCGAVYNFTIPTATDNCGTATVTQTDMTGLTSGSTFPVGATTLEFTADDGNGNTTVCSFTITVTDNENPTISCPQPVTVDADANCEVTTLNLDAPSTTDNCAVATVTNNLTSQLPLPVGNHIITWTVTDTSGLTSSCTQQVIVQDVTPPSITCPTVAPFYNTDSGQCTASLSFNAIASDNCSSSPIVIYEISGSPITFPYTFPVGTTTVDVIANDGNGLSSTCNFNVVVQDNEAPSVICQPLTLSLNASGVLTIAEDAVNNGSFDACGGLTFDTDITNFDCSNIGTNNVILRVTDANGNSATCNTTVTISDYIQGDTATIASSTNSPICQGESVTFTASGINLGLNPQYEWFVAGTSVGNNNATYTTSALTNNDNIYVEITSGPCNTKTTSNTITMTVNPLLPVSFTLNASTNPACNGDNLTFFITGLTNGGASPSYQWYEGGTPVGTNTNSYVSTTVTNNEIVSVEVTSSLACANPIPATESLTMIINPLPTVIANANASSTNITICEGDSLTLTGAGATTYTWDNGVTNNVAFMPSVGTHTYTVTGTNANGCEDTDTITVTVNPNAVITLLSASTNQSVCRIGGNPRGVVENIDFNVANASSVNVTGLPNGVNYSYNAGTGLVRINGNPNNGINGTFNYTLTASNGCNTATATGEITVYRNTPSRPGTINGPASFLCPVNTAVYYVSDDPNVETYNWTVPNTMTIIQGQGTNQIEVSITGTVTFFQQISVTASNACGTSSARTLGILLNFSAPGIDAGNDIYVCEGTNTVTMAGDDDGLNNTEWEWSDNAAGGMFSSVGTYDPPAYCDGVTFLGFCLGTIVDPPPRPLYTTNSTYTLPPGAVAGDIITINFIADSGGFTWCDNIEDSMRIYVIENPTASMAVPETICFGDDIVVNGTPNTSVSYTFNGSAAGSFNIGSSGSITFSNQPAGLYELTSIQYTNPPNNNGVGCINTLIGEAVTINAAATVTAPADITICEGSTVELSTASIGGTNAVGSWSTSGSGSFAGNIYTPSAGDIFNGSVTLTYTNSPSDGICSPVSDTMIVTINQAPSIYAGIDQTICSNDTVTMTASFGGSTTSGTWSGGTGTFSSNAPTASYTPGTGETGTVTLTYTSNDSDGSGPCGTAIDTVVITIDQEATVTAGADQTICSNDTVTLSGSYGGSASSASWSSSGTGSFSGNTYTPSTADITNGTVVLTYTTNNPPGVCGTVSESLTVTINQAATVDAGNDLTVCSNSNTVILAASSNTAGSWSGGSGSFSDITSPTATYTLGAGETSGNITLTYTTQDPDGSGPCSAVSDNLTISVIPYLTANPSYTFATNNGNCSDTVLNLSANGSGYWTAVAVTPLGSPFVFSDITNPNATFTGESGAEYNITWNLNNTAPCNNNSMTTNVVFNNCGNLIDFDGIDDSVNMNNNHNVSGNFSFEVWVKPERINNNTQTIFSKRDASIPSTGYDLSLLNNTISFNANGSNLSANGITNNRWYHIAVTYDGTYNLYVDGILLNNNSMAAPATNNSQFLLGAMDRTNNTPTNYFEGWMDEVRIWNVALTAEQIQLMMNQEIQPNAGQVIGSVTGPNVSSNLAWASLSAYYQMNQSTSDLNNGLLIANAGSINGRLRNITTNQNESAPIPYISNNNGNWTNANTWLNGNVQQLPNSNGVNGTPVDWNIVRTRHNISSTNKDITVLGLLVDNNRLTIENTNPIDGQSINVTKYLKIGDPIYGTNGVLDLEGESQLLQPMGSIVDYTGNGSLHRDQQGTANLFNYNYWSSPVSTDGNTYQIGSVLYDGNTPVNWTPDYSATGSTNPVTLSSRWLYLYENYITDNYASWNRINQSYNVTVGLGYTMKGSGVGHPINDVQNYTFVGQPNNGDLSLGITSGNEALIGNPYPSALDANQFIIDNDGIISGEVYFWEHSTTNFTHLVAEYEGGYAYYTQSGGTPAVSPPIGGTSVGDVGKIPQRYIPVGQGFFVNAGANGGTIVFNNNQRKFRKEVTPNTSQFIRTANPNVANNSNDEDEYQRMRFNFTSPEGAKRQLLLAFTPNNDASDGYDYGFDALIYDDFPSDMFFVIENKNYIIQGVGAFNEERMYPIAIRLGNTGNIKIELADLENFDDSINVFVFDALQGTYTRINDTAYQIALDSGNYNNRYFIAFKEEQSLNTTEEEFENVIVNYLNTTNEIYINIPVSLSIKQVYLVNMLGQTVRSWNHTNAPLSQECKIPVRRISEGAYIIKVRTSDDRLINKKIVVKQN